MARARGRGDQRGTRRDGPAGAGAAPNRNVHRGRKRASGQQSGSNRPAVRTGAAKRAPKKGGVPAKGTRRPGTASKTRPGKSRAFKTSRGRKP